MPDIYYSTMIEDVHESELVSTKNTFYGIDVTGATSDNDYNNRYADYNY